MESLVRRHENKDSSLGNLLENPHQDLAEVDQGLNIVSEFVPKVELSARVILGHHSDENLLLLVDYVIVCELDWKLSLEFRFKDVEWGQSATRKDH